jgi:hypothetical protein
VHIAALAIGCGAAPAREQQRADAPVSAGRGQLEFEGACDASGAVALSSRLLLVADDDDNVLHVYDAELGGRPVASSDLSEPLDLRVKGKKKRNAKTLDLEAGTRLHDRAYWLTSHSRIDGGKLPDERLLFFVTTAPEDGSGVHVEGRPYVHLLDDLLSAGALASLDLAASARLPAEAEGDSTSKR